MDAISVFAPAAADAEKALRARLYRSRDICGANAARADGWAQHIWRTAEDLAADTVWRRAPETELHAIADAVARMIQAASRLAEGGCNA